MKVNVDASWSMSSSDAGLSRVVRDVDGCVLGVNMQVNVGVNNVFGAEGRTLLLGLRTDHVLKLTNVVFESDCVNVFQAVTVHPEVRIDNIQRMQEVQNLFHKDWAVVAIHRETKTCADHLAKLALQDNLLWSDLTSCICSYLVACRVFKSLL